MGVSGQVRRLVTRPPGPAHGIPPCPPEAARNRLGTDTWRAGTRFRKQAAAIWRRSSSDSEGTAISTSSIRSDPLRFDQLPPGGSQSLSPRS